MVEVVRLNLLITVKVSLLTWTSPSKGHQVWTNHTLKNALSPYFINKCIWYTFALKGNGSFRPLSRSPRVVSPPSRFALHYVSRFALLPRVVSPTVWRVVSHFLNLFYWGYCVKFTAFAFFNEDFGYISLKNDMSFINLSKWYIYLYSV